MKEPRTKSWTFFTYTFFDDFEPGDKDVRTLAMWLSRQLENAESIQLQDKRPRYFRCEDVLIALENHPNIKMTADKMRIQILDAGIPKSKIS